MNYIEVIMKSIWKGSLSFGLVNIPVRLYVGSHSRELTFKMLHKKDLSEIRYARICKNVPVTWVKPKLVCEVSFAEWTNEGIMRQPIFKGMRIDKPAKEVVKEKPKRI